LTMKIDVTALLFIRDGNEICLSPLIHVIFYRESKPTYLRLFWLNSILFIMDDTQMRLHRIRSP
jgi:hypothetical protein